MYYDCEDDLTAIWNDRAKTYGKPAVIDRSVDYDAAYLTQTAALVPLFLAQTHERTIARVLDFGCGVGRFTPLLADLCPTALIVGYDPSHELIDLAPVCARCHYRNGSTDTFFARSMTYDAIWITLVLGGLPDDWLPALTRKLTSHLAPGGFVFFAEHLGEGGDFWKFRSAEFYTSLFVPLTTRQVGTYTLKSEVGVFVAT